jgi:uncharacterized membrane protein YccC
MLVLRLLGTLLWFGVPAGLLIALVRELAVEDYDHDFPRWAGFLVGLVAAGGGVFVAFLLR